MTITRIWQAGFESRDDEGADYTVPISNSFPRTGSWHAVSGMPGPNLYWGKTIPPTRQLRAASDVYNNTFLNNLNEGSLFTFRDVSQNKLVELRIDAVDATKADLLLYIDGALEDSDMTNLHVINTHHHYVIDVKIDPVSGWVKVYRNGIEIMSYTGNTGNADVVDVTFGTYYDMGTGTGSFMWDDVYIDDLTGEGTAAPGPLLRFYWLTPNGNGNYAQWLGSDDNSVDNYLLIDEVPPNEGDYVVEVAADQYDSYELSTIALSEGQEFRAVIPYAFSQRIGVSEQLAVGTRYSSTDVIGADTDAEYGAYKHVWDRQITKPGGGAWDQAAIDGVEVVIKSRGVF